MYEAVIGLEIHAQLKTKTKMFCASKNDPDADTPNVNICPICVGHPGTLPSINKKAVEYIVKIGCALNCKIAERTKFDRKNYFYPDIPKGYQISQYDLPLCYEGYLEILGKKIRITRVHLEEDTAKSIHSTEGYSYVDFNRSGAPLMELVTEPDIRNADEAKEFCENLQKILQYLGVSDANMEKGQMRCEVNISLKKKDSDKFGTKVEIKNLNSFKAVRDSIAFEIKRQTEILESGGCVVQETRGWDENKKLTFSQREKESAHDYRYFPEPDLPFIFIGKEHKVEDIIDIDKIKTSIPELTQKKIKRYQEEFQLSEKDARTIAYDKDYADFFEGVISNFQDKKEKEKLIKLSANYITTDIKNVLIQTKRDISELGFTPRDFAELILILNDGKINSAVAKSSLLDAVNQNRTPVSIIEEKGLMQINDEKQIEEIAKEVISQNPNPVTDYKNGNQNSIQFLVGQIMAKTKGRANPKLAREVLERLLQS